MPTGAPMHRRTALLMCPRWRGATATETLFNRGPQVLELYISHLKGPQRVRKAAIICWYKNSTVGLQKRREGGPVKPKFKTVANPPHLLIVV